jgi:hypothetical protein
MGFVFPTNHRQALNNQGILGLAVRVDGKVLKPKQHKHFWRRECERFRLGKRLQKSCNVT